MKQWPRFNGAGDLPVGIHLATLREVAEYFGNSTIQRRLVAQRLARIYDLAHSTGSLARFVVFGSFVTDKPNPNDVDIFMLMEDTFDFQRLTGEARLIFSDHLRAQSQQGASIFWIRRMAAIGGEQTALEDWQLKRDQTRRGIVEVTSYD